MRAVFLGSGKLILLTGLKMRVESKRAKNLTDFIIEMWIKGGKWQPIWNEKKLVNSRSAEF